MNPNVLDLKIKTGDTLIDFEKYNSRIKDNISEVHMRLSRNFEKKFFNDTWISSLIATASFGDKKLILTDWWDKSNNENIANRLSDSLIGITSAYLADEIKNSKDERLQIDIQEIITSVALGKRGLIDNFHGHTFTFCSFDSSDKQKYFPRPLALSAESLQEFTDKFLKIKRNNIDTAFGIRDVGNTLFAEYNTYQQEKNFAAFIYELYENTIQHGNKNESNNLIEGIRSFSIKRHIAQQLEELKTQAENFSELDEYLTSIANSKKHKNLWFYEVSIVDSGIGIVKRFLASRPDYKDDETFKQLSDFEKLNFIIEKSLSSKLFPGAGKGIKGALRNINSLDGFVSLRTNDIWVYFNGKKNSKEEAINFKSVDTDNLQLDSIRGTCYNILIPVSPQ